ncbi:MAG: PAS domain S-box protein [Holophagales bacterium]|nr:PAS domain S-box protein [Holophagales bacterium]
MLFGLHRGVFRWNSDRGDFDRSAAGEPARDPGRGGDVTRPGKWSPKPPAADGSAWRSEELYEELIRHQGEGVGIVDLEERFTFCNPAGEEIFGVPPGGMVGRTLREFTTPESYSLVLDQTRLRLGGEKSTYEMEITRAEGSTRWLLVTAVPRKDRAGRHDGTLGIFRDITKRREAEAALRVANEQLERKTAELVAARERLAILDQAKSNFLRVISHELRTPLNGLFGIAELLFSACPDDADGAEMKEHFRQSRSRLLALVDDALLLTQIDVGPGEFAPRLVELDSALRAACEKARPLAAARQVRLLPEPGEPALVPGDAALIQRALHALVETAVKFSAPGQTVRLTSASAPSETAVHIEARGHVVPGAALSRFFQLLAIGETLIPEGDLGLQPAMAERVFALFGGSVTVENLDPPGIRLTVLFRPPPETPDP